MTKKRAVSLAIVLSTGCGSLPPEPSGGGNVRTHRQAFSDFGTERVIPLRVVMAARDCAVLCGDGLCDVPETSASCPQDCPTCGNGYCETFELSSTCPQDCPGGNFGPASAAWGCPWRLPAANACTSTCTDGAANCGADTASYFDIRAGVEKVNWGLKALGVQIYVKSIEKYKMPHFWNSPDILVAPSYPWSNAQLRAELRLPYPTLTDGAFLMGDAFKSKLWMPAVATRVGEPREIIVWATECSAGWDGRRPWGGAASLVADREMYAGSPRGFAHEIAHVLGLEHDMYPAQSKNPEKPNDTDWGNNADYWDLVHGINGDGTNRYFSSRTEAWNWGGQLFPKHTWDPLGSAQNCWTDWNCTLTCSIHGQSNESTGQPGIVGLGFTFVGDNPGGGVYRRGVNSMMYIDTPTACNNWPGFSDSQAEQVKRLLRADIRIDDSTIGAESSRLYEAQRPLLGDVRGRWGFDKLDFDGDGKRDVAIYQPPDTPDAGASSRFQVLKSSSGFTSTTTSAVGFGRAGDVPVPADYDADGKTDYAFVRTGGVTTNPPNPFDSGMWWIWCRSSQGDSCAINGSCSAVNDGCRQWGQREDVALPGLEFDGNTLTREIAVYRPSTRQIYWRVLGSTTNGTISLSATQTTIVHLHGLYDSDNKTDIVVYEPGTARFYMLFSSNNWNPAQSVWRWFSSVLIADAVGASGAGAGAMAIRHGGVAVPVEKAGKRQLRVWDPYTGNFHTIWDPVTNYSIQTCQWGSPRDIAIAGPIDRNGDGITDLVVYRPTFIPPTVFVRSANTTTCAPAGSDGSFAVAGTPRSQLWGVTDMGGDGRGELLLLNPDQQSWVRYYSAHNGGFVAQATLNLGSLGAIGL